MNNKIKDLEREIEKLNNKEFFVLHISNGKNVVDWAFNKNDRIEKISERIRKELKFKKSIELISNGIVLYEPEIIKNKLNDNDLIYYDEKILYG